ncbi:hypothetical protein O5D80_002560 [Batrachochytrium dendrobatidis]|nr:hypothetical protein O5D80_002560 [Batrachochytrium dendrobatidis]
MLKPNGAEGQGVGWWATLRSQNDKDIPDWFTVRGPNGLVRRLATRAPHLGFHFLFEYRENLLPDAKKQRAWSPYTAGLRLHGGRIFIAGRYIRFSPSSHALRSRSPFLGRFRA